MRNLTMAHGLFQRGNPLINTHIERIYIGSEGAKLPAYLVSGCDGMPTLMKKFFATHENCYSLVVDFCTWGSRIVASPIPMADH